MPTATVPTIAKAGLPVLSIAGKIAIGSPQLDAVALYRTALGPDRSPDSWQAALATHPWPAVLVAPTGAGKTAAVTLGWAAHRLRDPGNTPLRLIWCLPMRALVEQTADAVKDWFRRLATEADKAGHLPRPCDVHVLMGGVDADGWLDHPERPAVLVGTQDMLLSRALMRGYASSRAIWPMEFALLHHDAQWVFDEVQLMGAGRATSVQLEAFRARASSSSVASEIADKPSRSLWISATLDPLWLATVDRPAPTAEAVVRVDPTAVPNVRLARLSQAAKRLTRSSVAPLSSTKRDLTDYIELLADAILDAHRPGTMTLAMLNRVSRAQSLHRVLEKRLSKLGPRAPTLAIVHSRFRPADRAREMEAVLGPGDQHPHGRVVIATQAVEAGVDVSAAVLFTELAPWSSLVQRFGRANRRAELPDGADVHWIDLLPQNQGNDLRHVRELAKPYEAEELQTAQSRLIALSDVASVHLSPADEVERPSWVIRYKDLLELFDTDPDLTGFDVDISRYVRDTDETDIRVFWRNTAEAGDDPPSPRREELCAVSVAAATSWISELGTKKSFLLFQRDLQWRRRDGRAGLTPPGWMPLDAGEPRPGLVLLADTNAGGYRQGVGFTGDPRDVPEPILDSLDSADTRSVDGVSDADAPHDGEGHDEDPLSSLGVIVPLVDHLEHVSDEAELLCDALEVESAARAVIVRAARWHDLGKVHEVFQDTMRRGLAGRVAESDAMLAKTTTWTRHVRPYFRHELASSLAFLAHQSWSRDADLVAYLIAAHHGKVRMNLRALPREQPPTSHRDQARFARGIWEGDELPAFDLGNGERWEGGDLRLSVMELGWDDISRESWTERTRELLARLGPFRLAWLETLVRVADWRASAKERDGGRDVE